MERPPLVEHWDVTNALVRLELNKSLSTRLFNKLRWYFLPTNEWGSVEARALEKLALVRSYSSYPYSFRSEPEGVRYDDITEYFVENALKETGFTLYGKSTSYFNGVAYSRQGGGPSNAPDLDFTAGALANKILVGVSVKNQLDYPKQDDVEQLVDMCSQLKLRPLLVARMLSGPQVQRIHGVGGYSVVYKRWMLQPGMEKGLFYRISDAGKRGSVLDLPVSIYRRTPSFLVRGIEEAARALWGEVGVVS